ncbi:bifunctional folylpolyglutamate synthase/dihydrofolate synthase [Paenibacillus yanchengensis]|uniref:tetrahydrofolate synthase n=1 Tax=Paenibacillus yanchengensis TaxID=2035833 RepID=A0ABW4YL73_9BACL
MEKLWAQRETNLLQSYDEAVEWINGLIPFGIRPGLSRIEKMMELLGNPERRLQFIHVAGTNGKGSTCSMIANVLLSNGYDVGLYTSPYITKFTNRFQYNGTDIEEETLVKLANQLKPIVEEIAETELGSPTMFEVSTALAILFFATDTFPDYVVFETGLGGRLDVTNIVRPVISVITNVGHDHMDRLGNTLSAIASEKAGIIKPNVPIVSAVEQPEVIQVIADTAAKQKSSLYLLHDQFEETVIEESEMGQSFSFKGPFRTMESIEITLNGSHQRKNAAVAMMTLEVLRQYNALVLDDDLLLAGFKTAAWPGRLELVSHHPRIVIDGAHNPEGAEVLSRAIPKLYSYEKLHLMIAMLDNKNHRDTLKHILPLVDTLIVTEPDFRMKKQAVQLAELIDEMRAEMPNVLAFELIIEPNWETALSKLQQLTEDKELAVVTGTLYLIADVRAKLLQNSEAEKGW